MLPRNAKRLTCGCRLGAEDSPKRWRHGRDIGLTVVTIGLWGVMPKCPLCVAAYVAMWTGLGLSLAEACLLRSSLLAGSGAVLLYVAVKRGSRAMARS